MDSDGLRISYVIPTRNRPEMFERALLSLIEQTQPCFEVVVSDNSDEKTSSINFEIYSRHRRDFVKYVRPTSVMSMTSHWDWAIQHATGDYVGILTDRMLLKPKAIATLAEAIGKSTPMILGYQYDVLEDESPPFLFKRTACTGETIIVPSRLVIDAARKGRISRMWPRMLNSLCHQSVLDKMRSLYGEVFAGRAPDYSFFFRAMDLFESFAFLDERVLISSGKHRSNGENFIKGSGAAEAVDFVSIGRNLVDKLPADGLLPWTSLVPYNIEAIEYERARGFQRSGAFRELCRASFYRNARNRISQLRSAGINTRHHERDIESFRVANKIGWHNKLVHDIGLYKYGAAIWSRLNRLAGKELQRKYIVYTEHATVKDALSYDSINPFRTESRNASRRILSELTQA